MVYNIAFDSLQTINDLVHLFTASSVTFKVDYQTSCPCSGRVLPEEVGHEEVRQEEVRQEVLKEGQHLEDVAGEEDVGLVTFREEQLGLGDVIVVVTFREEAGSSAFVADQAVAFSHSASAKVEGVVIAFIGLVVLYFVVATISSHLACVSIRLP